MIIVQINSIRGARAVCRILSDHCSVINILSPVNAGAIYGAAWFHTLLKIVRKENNTFTVHGWLDCGKRVSSILSAIELRIEYAVVDKSIFQIDHLRNSMNRLAKNSKTCLVTGIPSKYHIYTMDDFVNSSDLDLYLRLRGFV